MSINDIAIYIKTPEGFFVFIGILIGIIGLFLGRKYIIKKQKVGDNRINIQSDSVDVGGDVIGRDKNVIGKTNSDTLLSNLEKIILKYLYKKVKDNLLPRDKMNTIFSKLEINEGTDVRTLNDSEYLKIEGEEIVMTSTGIRYMDNLSEFEIEKIILPEDRRFINKIIEEQRLMMEENKRNYYRDSNK